MKSDAHPPSNDWSGHSSSNLIIGSWRHSHEEDSGDAMVFRSLDYPFPPSRGRVGFQLEPAGQGVFRPPGRDDRGQKQACTWELSTEGILTIHDLATRAMLLHGHLIRIESGRLELSLRHDSPS